MSDETLKPDLSLEPDQTPPTPDQTPLPPNSQDEVDPNILLDWFNKIAGILSGSENNPAKKRVLELLAKPKEIINIINNKKRESFSLVEQLKKLVMTLESEGLLTSQSQLGTNGAQEGNNPPSPPTPSETNPSSTE